MQRKVIIGIALILVMILALSLPAAADEYKRTSTGFRYIGEIFHEKQINYHHGAGSFYIRGYGEVSGSHDVHTVKYGETQVRRPQNDENDNDEENNDENNDNNDFITVKDSKVNISMYIRGRTDPAAASDQILRMEEQALAEVQSERERAIQNLNARRVQEDMDGATYQAEMRRLQDHYDELIKGIIDAYSEAKRNIRILSSNQIKLPRNEATVRVGVDMNPGEEGYIRQSIASVSGSEEYLKIRSDFENTGGTTKRQLEVDGFINETMRVDGYARVYESSEVREGRTKTGWWDTQP